MCLKKKPNTQKPMTTIYEEPQAATYFHKIFQFGDAFQLERMCVQVIGETAKCYIIKASQWINSHKPGDLVKVHRKNIQMAADKAEWCTNQWWNK